MEALGKNTGKNIELKIMKMCPYEVLTVTLLNSGEEKRTTCKTFRADQMPYFEIYKKYGPLKNSWVSWNAFKAQAS